jgi:hypothetical protein
MLGQENIYRGNIERSLEKEKQQDDGYPVSPF